MTTPCARFWSRLTRRPGRTLGLLLLLALALRFGYILYAGDRIHNEGKEYYPYAENLAAGRGYYQVFETGAVWYSRRLPVIPVLLAFLKVGLGDGYRYGAGFLYALFSAAAVWVAYALGRVSFNRRVGLLAAALLAVYPEAIYYSNQLNDGAPMLLLTALVLLFFARLLKRGRPLDAALTGFWLGVSALTHSHLALFWVPMLLCLALGRGPRRSRLVNAALLLLVFALVLAPWTIRNHRLHGVVMPGGSSFWREVYIANNETIPDNLGGFNATLAWNTGYFQYGELKANELFKRDTVAYLTAHPGQYLWFALNRLWGLWRPIPHLEYVSWKYGLVMLGSYGALIPFILWGGWASVRSRWRRHLVYYLLFAYFSAICAAVICVTRYRLFFTAPLLLFAAYGLLRAGDRWRRRR